MKIIQSKTETKMKNLFKLFFTIVLVAILFAGCSTEDNPITPTDPGNGSGDPDPTINTPKNMRITSITVTNFPDKKPNGDHWDFSPILPLSSRPDLFVELSINGSNSSIFRSKTEQDASYLSNYTFTEPALSSSESLPHNAAMNTGYIIELYDNDVTFNDFMGSVIFTPSSLYNDDNAENFSKSMSSGSIEIRIDGTWEY